MAMSYAEAVAALSGLAQSAPSLSLARMEALCARLGSPEQRFRSVLVGGSAGKGSTTAFLAAILHAAGRRVGSAPKPHLWSHCERVQVNGEPIGVADFAAVLERVLAVAPEVTRTVGPVTVFEALTTVAFLHFAESGVEQAVIEVGLGGRYDATNVLPAELAVITMIGLDHTDRLGTTHAAIAGEKAGILRAGRPVVTGATGDGLAVIEARAARLGCPVWRLGREIQLTDVRPDRPGVEFSFRSPLGSLPGLFASLTGGHQARNAALAVSAAQLLDFLSTLNTLLFHLLIFRLPICVLSHQMIGSECCRST